MSRIIVLIASLAVAVVLLGCSKTENTNENKAAPTTSTGTTSTTGTSTTTASSNDKIGVPECDDFIAKYESCVSSKVPEMARAQYKSAVDQWRASWKKLADNPATKGSLAAACKQAADQQTAALKSFGCTF